MITDPKAMAKVLRADLAERGIPLSHGACLELIAHIHGWADWNTMSSRLVAPAGSPGLAATSRWSTLPVLRAAQVGPVRALLMRIGFVEVWREDRADRNFAAELAVGPARIQLESFPGLPSGHVYLDVPDVDWARQVGMDLDGLHLGATSSATLPSGRFRVLTVSDRRGHLLLTLRDTLVDRTVGQSSGRIVADVVVPASGGFIRGAMSQESWLFGALFEKRTGGQAAGFSGGWPRRGGEPLLVGQPGDVVLGRIHWRSADSSGLEMGVVHDMSREPSRITLQTVEGAPGTVVVTLVHDGWTESNLSARVGYLDWQRRLDQWACAVVAAD